MSLDKNDFLLLYMGSYGLIDFVYLTCCERGKKELLYKAHVIDCLSHTWNEACCTSAEENA